MIDIVRDDCRRALPGMAPGKFRCCVTSPPYWEQREYLPLDHHEKALEIGHEPTPALYAKALVAVFREVRRVLKDDGTLWVNIGDKYASEPGGWKPGGLHFGTHNRLIEQGSLPRKKLGRGRTPGLAPKQLIGLPWRFAFAMQDDGWILRSDIIWWKSNTQPSSVRDRPTTAHEYVFLFAKGPEYFYDQDAVREPTAEPRKSGRRALRRQHEIRPRGNHETLGDYNDLGRNLRSVWCIPTGDGPRGLPASEGDHVAPMPRKLARIAVLAGSQVGDHVLDPFGGRGTTGAVAEQEGRHATLIDLDDRAVALAHETTAQTGLFTGAAS